MKKIILPLFVLILAGTLVITVFRSGILNRQNNQFVSDPIYGDQITQEELDQLKNEDQQSDTQTVDLQEEFQIDLNEDQATAGL